MYSAVFQANKKKKLVKVKIVSILAAPPLKATYMKGILLLRVLAHTSCGNDRQTPLLLYRTLIIYKLKNGCKINSSSTEARLRVLDSVHHAGVRLSSGAFRSSPILSLLVDAGFLPLDLRRQSILLRCWYHVQRLPNSVSCEVVSRDSSFRLYVSHPSLPNLLVLGLHLLCDIKCTFFHFCNSL